jgi:hypothetical protein
MNLERAALPSGRCVVEGVAQTVGTSRLCNQLYYSYAVIRSVS